MFYSLNGSWQSMRKWLLQPLGQYYIEVVHEQVSNIISKSFGYHLLVIGEPGLANCVVNSPIKHHVLVHHSEDSQREIYSLCCSRQDKLPIETESIDIVYLAHCLELYKNPHEILREAYRILRPEGRIIISGFNPWSIWGAYCIVGNLLKCFPWKANLVSRLKLKDWLQLLGFSYLKTHKLFYYLPFANKILFKNMKVIEEFASKFNMPFGGAYLVMAYKSVLTLTPIVPEWKVKPYLVTDHLAEATPQKYNSI